MSYALDYPIAEQAPANARAAFIRRTYGHLAGAILAFIALEFLVFGVLLPDKLAREGFFGDLFAHPGSLLVLLVAFIGGGYLAQFWARSATSQAMQYVGLGLYVVLEAVIFVPILWVATDYVKDPNIIPTAGILTLAIFGGLTTTVFVTRKDFSFLGPILSIACFVALALIVIAMFIPGAFGGLGLWFSFAMVAVASGWILYDTSNIIHHYRTDQHVAAALALFASVALLFFYILRILIEVSGRGNR
jgi:FtsH-binding integral membrane protein